MFKKKKIIAITLARGGSKAIKNKNIIKLNNLPLISYTIREAKKSKYIDEYIVSTDSKKIKKVAEKYGAYVPFLRPKNIATDKATSVDALVIASAKEKDNGPIGVRSSNATPLADLNLLLSSTALE